MFGEYFKNKKFQNYFLNISKTENKHKIPDNWRKKNDLSIQKFVKKSELLRKRKYCGLFD